MVYVWKSGVDVEFASPDFIPQASSAGGSEIDNCLRAAVAPAHISQTTGATAGLYHRWPYPH